MMIVLKQLLKKMYHNYAVVFPGVDAKTVAQVGVTLVKNRMPRIPAEYAEFLGMTDGLYWNGLELYSLNEHERNNGEYMHTGIMQSFTEQMSNPLLKNKLILGVAPEELIVYYAAQKEYQILDRYTYKVIIKLPRFFDVLYFYAGSLIE